QAVKPVTRFADSIRDAGATRRSGSAVGGDRRAVAALPVDHVVAGDRHRLDGLGELHLEIDVALIAEGDLRAGEVEFPHPAEALVVKVTHRLAVGEEALAPGAQRMGVM